MTFWYSSASKSRVSNGVTPRCHYNARQMGRQMKNIDFSRKGKDNATSTKRRELHDDCTPHRSLYRSSYCVVDRRVFSTWLRSERLRQCVSGSTRHRCSRLVNRNVLGTGYFSVLHRSCRSSARKSVVQG